MEAAGLFSGASPVIKRYQVDATFATRGVPALIAAANGAGITVATATSATDCVGLVLDTATYTTTQGTGADSAERQVSVVINPDLIFRARLSGGATAGTALTLYDVTTASAGGTAITTGDDWSSPEFDEGTVWGYDGANVGQFRKITSTSTTAATVTVPFDYATVVGDNFLRAPFTPMQHRLVRLTTGAAEVDASVAVGGSIASWAVIDLELRDASESGRTDSWVHMIAGDHFLNPLS